MGMIDTTNRVAPEAKDGDRMHGTANLTAALRARLRRLEAIIATVVASIARFLSTRFPLVAIAAVYLMILIAAPAQITHILANFSTEATPLQWASFMLPPVLAAAANLALAASRHVLRWTDLLVACMPAIALCAMTALWAPGLLIVALPGLLTAIAAAGYARRIATRRPNAALTVAIVGTLACFAATLIATTFSSIDFPVMIGPLTVLTLGLSCIGLLLGIAALRPGLAGTYLALCSLAVSCGPGSRPVPLIAPELAPSGGSPTVHAAFEAWVKSRPDLDAYRKAGKPYPVVIASAEGGGIYAAAHGYLALSAMQAICPSFPNHLFATVGVSGGSIGTLLYAANSAPRTKTRALVPCRRADPKAAGIDTRPLTTDLISPPLANLLFAQVADFLLPFIDVFPDSGEILARAIAGMVPNNPYMTEPLRASWRPDGSRPVTLFVTTDIGEGNRVVLSPLDSAGAIGAASFPSGSITSPRDIATSDAAFISARFPWLTPTARLRVSENSYRILADGGYYENSGADTAMDLVAQIRELGALYAACVAGSDVLGDLGECKCPVRIQRSFTTAADWSGCGVPVFLAYMPIVEANDKLPGYTYEDSPNPPQSWLADPLNTMLQARSARGMLAVDRSRAAFAPPQDREMAQGTDVDSGYFPHRLPIKDLRLPLGWKLSRASIVDVLSISAKTEACDRPYDAESSIAAWTENNGCQMALLASLFNPSGAKGAIGRREWGRD